MSRVWELIDRLNPRGLLYSTYEQRLLAELDRSRLPKHVAVLADGNRRWAKLNAQGQSLTEGYKKGADKLVEFCHWCDDVGIQVVTLWVLSTDNLNRGGDAAITPILDAISGLITQLSENADWHVRAMGDLTLLPEPYATDFARAKTETEGRAGLHINVAVGYGGRHELLDAVRSLLASEAERGATLAEVAEHIEFDSIAEHLYTKGQPDPDLIIRTSGEQRMSGFLMWQSAHSEYYFCEALWPDFRRVDFVRALRSYTQRERRFGR